MKTKQQRTRAPCVWSPAFTELSVLGGDSFPGPHHSHFSSLSVNTGPFCPQRALPQAEVQTHFYFLSSFVRYVTLQNQLRSGSPRTGITSMFNPWTSKGSLSSANQVRVSPLTSPLSAHHSSHLFTIIPLLLYTTKLLGIVFAISSSLVGCRPWGCTELDTTKAT